MSIFKLNYALRNKNCTRELYEIDRESVYYGLQL